MTMTKPLTPEEATTTWKSIEAIFTGAALTIQGRCYTAQSSTGIRYVMMVARRHFIDMELMLLELEAKGVEEK